MKRITLTSAPPTVFRRQPANYSVSDAHIFSRAFEIVLPEISLYTIPNVCAGLCDEGVLFQSVLLHNLSFPSQSFKKSFPSNANHARFKFLIKFIYKCLIPSLFFKKKIRTGYWITDIWSGSYFHWITDCLPRLLVLGQLDEHINLFLPGNLAHLPYVHSSLSVFPNLSVNFIYSVTSFQSLSVPSHTAPSGNYNPELINRLRSLYLRNITRDTVDPKFRKIYISRSKASRRRIANEDECTKLLSSFGFVTVILEDLDFTDQVKLCSSAEILVSNHGAGLTNMLFMTPGMSVLELRDSRDVYNNCFYSLASALDLTYYYQLCKATQDTSTSHLADIEVDIGLLFRNLKLITSAR